MPNWMELQALKAEPTILDAIEFVAGNACAAQLPEPAPKRRVRILHDGCPTDPREDMDFMCEINGDFGWRDVGRQEHYVNLISQTDAYNAACKMLSAASPDGVFDPPDLYDETIRDQWLETLRETELKTVEFLTQSYRYVAHTTPEMCAKLGVDWARAAEAMAGEVEMFRQWADGEVYGFVVEKWVAPTSCECDNTHQANNTVCRWCWEGGRRHWDDPECDPDTVEMDEDDEDNWEQEDSCWGFYGDDPFENGMSEHVDEELHEQLRAAAVEY